MCNFFSFISDRKGKMFYFNWIQRQKILKGKLKDKNGNLFEADSHTSIVEFEKEKRNYMGKNFDKLFNFYEYNPLTKELIKDIIHVKNDSEQIKKQCDKLDFSLIVKPLIIKKIINPFVDIKCLEVNKNDIKLLKQWDSVRASARNSVGGSVWDSVRASARNSVGGSVWDSVGGSVWDSVWGSVWDSVGGSVWDSVGAYTSSFFDIKYKYDFSSCVKLWHKGLVPSFDGKIWRLHGNKGKILWEGKI